MILVLFQILGFVYIQNDYIEISKYPQNTVELHVAIAELKEVAKEVKVSFLVPEGQDYEMWISMQEKPALKFKAMVGQLNWWIRCRINKCASIPEPY